MDFKNQKASEQPSWHRIILFCSSCCWYTAISIRKAPALICGVCSLHFEGARSNHNILIIHPEDRYRIQKDILYNTHNQL